MNLGHLVDPFGVGKKVFGSGGWQNPADAGMNYLNKIPGQYSGLQDTYSGLTKNPGQQLNQIGQGFQQSPGFNFALQQALGAGNNAARAGGMLGSPQHEFQSMQTATGLANQDYHDWISKALGLYGTGLSGQQGVADSLAGNLQSQANYAYGGADAMNQHRGGMLGNLFQSFSGGMPQNAQGGTDWMSTAIKLAPLLLM